MNRDFEFALDESLQALRAGASLEECLTRFPEHAEVLRPLLETAAALSDVNLPRPQAEAVRRSRERMFQAADELFAAQPVSVSRFSRYVGKLFAWITGKENLDMRTTTRLATGLVVLVLLVVSGLGVNFASANALPGDTLYPAKRLLEQVRLGLTLDPQRQEALKAELQTRRQDEVRTVLQMQRQTQVDFMGALGAFDETQWTVGGFALMLMPETRIQGSPAAGAMVSVQAVTQADGTLRALTLTVLPAGGGTPYPAPGSETTHTPMPSHTAMPSPMPSHTAMPSPMPSHTAMPSPMPSHTAMPSPMPSHTAMPGMTPMPTMPGGHP